MALCTTFDFLIIATCISLIGPTSLIIATHSSLHALPEGLNHRGMLIIKPISAITGVNKGFCQQVYVIFNIG